MNTKASFCYHGDWGLRILHELYWVVLQALPTSVHVLFHEPANNFSIFRYLVHFSCSKQDAWTWKGPRRSREDEALCLHISSDKTFDVSQGSRGLL